MGFGQGCNEFRASKGMLRFTPSKEPVAHELRKRVRWEEKHLHRNHIYVLPFIFLQQHYIPPHSP
jgi:hypothetical protein